MLLRCCALALALSATATLAAQGAWEDFRLIYGLGFEEVTFTPAVGEGVDKEWDDSQTYGLGLYRTTGSRVFGLVFKHQRAEVSLPSPAGTLEYADYGVEVHSGFAIAPSRRWQVELALVGGGGYAEAEFGGDEDDNWFFSYGAEVMASVSFTDIVIGAGAQWKQTENTFELNGKRDLDQSGLIYMAFVGMRY